MHSARNQQVSDDSDRTNRFLASHGADTPNSLSLRERAASQPPHSSSQAFLASSPQHSIMRTNSSNTSAWPRVSSGLNPNPSPGSYSSSVPIRSASFSSNHSSTPQAMFSSAMRERSFASTFEDDESEAFSDNQDPYDDRYNSPSDIRGRTFASDISRSRSQSIATTTRPGMPTMAPGGGLWGDSPTNSLSIPGRYGELKPPGSSRYGSLGAIGRSPSNGYSGSFKDHSNMSPFVRDVGQILLDDGAAFREQLWNGMNPPRDENGGGGSGTTSRRHSVSVVQPRRPAIVGFNAPETDIIDETRHSGAFHSAAYPSSGGGGLLLTDDDLASDLGMLNLGDRPRRTSLQQPPSQPASLPIYAPLSRSPPSAADRVSPYQALQLNIPGSSYANRGALGSPSDSGISQGSPSRAQMDEAMYINKAREAARQGMTARFVPGQGIQHIPEGNVIPSPISPIGMRSSHYQQGHSPQIQRRPSDATKPLSELGKGVPLHSVPTSWPLFIVEFKAGRTDLFYCTDLSQDIRAGDLVVVEADRGKDLGKVVNDTITLAEVEAFQKQQKLMNMADAPTSPTGTGPTGVKDINPKMIYAKASRNDIQGLAAKLHDEAKALELCKTKVKQRKLPMEVIDAEYQWFVSPFPIPMRDVWTHNSSRDRRKLTFYFIAEKRIDFRELVRELFRYAFRDHLHAVHVAEA
ncbi:PSP1-domain-containing protein [Cristinia sonorae]|uniref:PSP1-domain-containing protein n=1 Tax=Cristinia sonorae TaxID=1940300 RepID=A0A8K0UQU9_9AGAR|nr:PSP1-domain-containing protein [Cristinia sonorae]